MTEVEQQSTVKEKNWMRYIITGLLIAIFVITKPSPANINNSGTQNEATKPTVQQVQATAQPPKPIEPSPQPVKQPEPEKLSSKEELMQAAGISKDEWEAVDYIVSHESSWNHLAVNKESGAYGLCQSLPASKMASAGADWETNPVTQLKWCHNYAQDRYGSWWSSFAFWQSNRWW